MATKQQLKTQLDVLREENQRLEGMLQQRPQRSLLTPRTLSRSEKAWEEAVTRELSTVREENEQLRQEILEQKERARLAEQEKEASAELLRLRQEAVMIQNSQSPESETLRQELARAIQEAEAAE